MVRCHDCCADAVEGRARCEACLEKRRRVKRDTSFAADVGNVLRGSRRMGAAARGLGWRDVEAAANANAEAAVELERALEAVRAVSVRPNRAARRCTDCWAVKRGDRLRCERCLRKNCEQVARRRARHRRENACACGRPRDRSDRKACDRCLERERRRGARRRTRR